MSGISHWKYDFRHVHCSAFCTVSLFRLRVIGGQVSSAAMLFETCPMTVVSCNKYSVLLTDFLKWLYRIKLSFVILMKSYFIFRLFFEILSFLSGYLLCGCRIKFDFTFPLTKNPWIQI
jgi:hypothetical protein